MKNKNARTLSSLTHFESLVLRAVSKIPRGETRTYSEIARAIGRPGAARAVGNALARNPMPIKIPCHRVVRSNGSPGGYSGPGGNRAKRRLLAAEAGKPPKNPKNI
ncbi:Methylated-DNA--protein-cysteine methyltransferase [Candidatus Burarchaeum australiense]|nr:Methylated-DNA--protein-cysteine methyltransferase [Candidatus Burarchaeum australiense]